MVTSTTMWLIKNSNKSLRGLAREIGIPAASFSNSRAGSPVRHEYVLKMEAKRERMRTGGAIKDCSLLLPKDASLFFRYATCDKDGRWALYDTPQPPVYRAEMWRYQHDEKVPFLIAGIFAPVPGDLSPVDECLYQRDLETRLWYKIYRTYNARIYSDEEVSIAQRNPRVLTPYERLEKAKLYRPLEEDEDD